VIDRERRLPVALLVLLLCAAACGSPSPSASVAGSGAASPSTAASSSAGPSAPAGQVIPAPGSDSNVYLPNPGAIVVAIDPGHGGCLDWGVPDPAQRGIAFSEKTMTLGIGLELRRLLEAEGITVVMTRERDEALAGDHYPPLGCHGAPFRDVNGDGERGFLPDDPEGAVRTRDELQARLDLANVARADVLISMHINSLTQDGVVLKIAATETFYTDETPWGSTATVRLAQLVQEEVMAALDPVTDYERQDRGIEAHNLFIVAPPLFKTTPQRPDKRKQPTRGSLMPSVLTEVGSITLAAEQRLLSSARGQRAAAQGIAAALADYFSDRRLAARYALSVDTGGIRPTPVPGDGPPFWIPELTAQQLVDGVDLTLTNTGSAPWGDGMRLVAGWAASDQPYLRVPPRALTPLPIDVLALAPGESVVVRLALPPPDGAGRQVAWVSLADGNTTLSDLGVPPLQFALAGG
jgi:N-acetylmuramoyl-L-alanine amidase